MRLQAGALFLALSSVLLASACGDNGDAETGAQTSTAGQELGLTLNEYSITDEQGGTVPAVDTGTVAFIATNEGILAHDLIVIRNDLPANQLPLDGSVVDVDAVDVLAGVQAIPAGQMDTLSADLETGQYVLICNVSGHYDLGMYATLTVQ